MAREHAGLVSALDKERARARVLVTDLEAARNQAQVVESELTEVCGVAFNMIRHW